ncbi:MAG: glycosyltransferase family 2 protein [Ignavibacteria bacterium]|nr:MAG: glycosyltransferase family 2 protein [Ignavibacteria bacterium]
MRTPLSVIIITLNEEERIVDCLKSVEWADDIVVVDSGSTDRTVELAKQYTQKVLAAGWMGFPQAKTFALRHAANEWVLWLDADERVSPELAGEIRDILRRGSAAYAGFEVARRAYFIGKWIRHCGWYPGYVVRLFRKDAGAFTGSRVHEKLEVRGPVGRLRHDLFHFTDENLYHYFGKFNTYTSLAAEDARDAGKRFSYYNLLVRPPYLFFKMYILRLGFLDGMHGFTLSLLSAAYVFVKYAKVWELSSGGGPLAGTGAGRGQ